MIGVDDANAHEIANQQKTFPRFLPWGGGGGHVGY